MRRSSASFATKPQKKAAVDPRGEQAQGWRPPEACKLFNAFSAAEEKMLKYAETNAVWCGIPLQIIQQIKQSHAKTTEFRTRICQAAAAAAAAARGRR